MRVLVHHCPAAPAAAPPVADEAHVWVIPLDRPPADPAELRTSLTPEECDRADRYRATAVRHQFVVGRGLLRRALGSYLGLSPLDVPITYTPDGKPVLGCASLHFNLTHTPGLALIAVAARRIGVDAERVRTVADADGLVGRFFSPAEQVAFGALSDDHRPAAFFRAWTCKEAVIKAAGTSVRCLDGFDVELHPERPPAVLAVRHEALTAAGWVVGAWEPAPGFAAAVAVEGTGELRIEIVPGERRGVSPPSFYPTAG